MPPEKEIKVTVVYPVTFTMKVAPHQDILILRAKIKDEADEAFNSSDVTAIITECDDFPELIE